jgi:hypothetical protein
MGFFSKILLISGVLLASAPSFGGKPEPLPPELERVQQERLIDQAREKEALAQDLIMAAEAAQADLIQQKLLSDMALPTQFQLNSMGVLHDKCKDDDGSGIGEKLCWENCVQENWSLGYCKSSCGVNTGPGANQCWKKCEADNWSFGYCKDNCGIKGKAASACWNKCDKDNWSFGYCVDNCGVDNGFAKKACYDKCKKDNWSFNYCKEKCDL